jgi:hypothetical protein
MSRHLRRRRRLRVCYTFISHNFIFLANSLGSFSHLRTWSSFPPNVVSREERVDRLTEVSNTVSTSQGPEKKNSATPTVAKEQRSLPGQSQRQPNPVDSPSESLVSTESLLDLPNMANMSPDLQVWQNKQLENFLKSLEVARRTILGQEKCAHCGAVIPKDDNCGMKDGRIYCSKCLNTPLVLLGIFKKK